VCFRVLPRMQPPTYEVDGFTHATADPSFLIGVANHFYKTTQPEWICLGMTRASLAAAQITLKFEDPSPVGTTQALNQEQSGGQRFPVRMRPPLHRPNMDGDACMHAPACRRIYQRLPACPTCPPTSPQHRKATPLAHPHVPTQTSLQHTCLMYTMRSGLGVRRW
jgi:hypothetical protein